MSELRDLVKVQEQMIADAAAWYGGQIPMPEAFRVCHKEVIRRARRMCKGDWRYCVLDGDGIVVHDRIMWNPERAA